MAKKIILLAFAFFVLSGAAPAAQNSYIVTNASDEQAEGTLRTVLQYACDSEGSDYVTIGPTRLDVVRIYLKSPLVIPADCKGPITMVGSSEAETVLDASKFSAGSGAVGDKCTLDIYSDSNSVSKFTFVNNYTGAAVCVYGRHNTVDDNHIGTEERGLEGANNYGVVIWSVFNRDNPEQDGAFTTLNNNIIGPQTSHGVWLHADNAEITKNRILKSGGIGLDIVGGEHLVKENSVEASGGHGVQISGKDIEIAGNKIVANGGCPDHFEYIVGQPDCDDSTSANGSGIFIKKGSENIVIGGDNFTVSKNTIAFNKNGGVVLDDYDDIVSVKITHNSISKNYGNLAQLDLAADGTTKNDIMDDDVGPDNLLNFHEHLQTFQIVPSGGERYWVWGVSFYSDDVELYQVAPEDQARENLFGGGDVWIADLVPTNSGFETIVKPANMDGSRAVATLSFDGADTSEFGLNAAVAKDTDYDGIPDELETGDGTVQSGGTSPEDADSDGDGLPDPIEDKNRNGIWDKNEGELCAYNPDTDSDGLSDWAETHGDGVYDKGIDTDPFNPDTDGDGLLDGQEDANGNGIWDGYLKESSPLLADSDGDGFADKIDTCPSIANPGQDPWYCK